MNRSILELPNDIDNSKNTVIVSPEYLKGRGQNAPFLAVNINFTPSIDIKVHDIFGLGKVSAQLVKLKKNIQADEQIVEYLDKSTIEWYSELCYRIGEGAIGIIHRAIKIPTKLILPSNSLADGNIYENVSVSQQIIRDNSALKLIDSTDNWELLPPNCIERFTLPSGYYLGTKNSVGKPQNGILMLLPLLPKNEPISIRNGKPDV
jgi:hypothetical protein